MVKTFKNLNEYYEMSDYYSFWGWIIPAGKAKELGIEKERLMDKTGKRGSGILYVPTPKDYESSSNFTHTKLIGMINVPRDGSYGYFPGYKAGMIRFYVEQGDLQIAMGEFVNLKTLFAGMTALNALCNGVVSPELESHIVSTFGEMAEARRFDSIRVTVDTGSLFVRVRGSNPSAVISALKNEAQEEPKLKKMLKEDFDLNYAASLIAGITKNKQSVINMINEETFSKNPYKCIEEALDIALSLVEAPGDVEDIPEPIDAPAEPPVEPKPEPTPDVSDNTEDPEQSPNVDENIEEKIKAEIDTEQDEVKKQILINLLDLVPALKKFSKDTYKNVLTLLYNFQKSGDDESKISESDKLIMADIAYDIMNTIVKNKDLVSIINTESKIMINSSYEPIMESELDEAKKKKKPGKKKKDEGAGPKLEVLLRLGLVPKELFTRAKKALNAKKETGSIPMYRNLLFDILSEIVSYIEKDPTLYNRMRINVMKEVKKSYPTKQTIMNAFEEGKKCKAEEREMPQEFEEDYMLKSAWTRGFNDKTPPTATKETLKEEEPEVEDELTGDEMIQQYQQEQNATHCGTPLCKYSRPCQCRCDQCTAAKSQETK